MSTCQRDVVVLKEECCIYAAAVKQDTMYAFAFPWPPSKQFSRLAATTDCQSHDTDPLVNRSLWREIRSEASGTAIRALQGLWQIPSGRHTCLGTRSHPQNCSLVSQTQTKPNQNNIFPL